MSHHKVCIIYPADPMGVVAGGVDTFIRGILKWAPDDIEVSLVGVTTDNDKRPVGTWTDCDLGRKIYRFFPVAHLGNAESKGRIPLTIKFIAGLIRFRPKMDADVLEFHRIEPSIPYYFDRRPKNIFMHQNMQVLRNADSDILWKRIPGLYFWLEHRLMRSYSSLFAVREDAVEAYKKEYKDISDRFRFIPTWYDPDVFSPDSPSDVNSIRGLLNVSKDELLLVTVGRLDHQKDPLLLLDAFERALAVKSNIRLVFIGDGVLRSELEKAIADKGLQNAVTLAGLKPASEIARILQAAELFVLSSAYEGMPMCVLEALGSGVPVVTTDVGEVSRVVRTGVNGYVVEDREPTTLAKNIVTALGELPNLEGIPCLDAVENYTPANVLQRVYENYRTLSIKAGTNG